MSLLYGALLALVPRDEPAGNGSSSSSGGGNSTFSAGPPGARSRKANHSTLLVSWWCTGFALVIILVRLWGRYERTRKFFMEDKIVAASIVPLLLRMGLAHPILLFGTNNINTVGVALAPEQLHLHSVGARIVLASRIFYALFIWTAKFAVSEYLKRLVGSIWTEQYQRVLRFLRIFLIVTFLGVVVATLSECQPFSHYWQVVPDPGPKCRNGYSQLLTMGLCDIITDVLLILFPMHLIWNSTMQMRRKLTLSFLFSLSLILIAITSYRIFAILDSKGRQQLRTLWASLEILAAAAVSNALVLGSFLRDRGVKRAKYSRPLRSQSVSTTAQAEPSINRSMTQQHWGNDSDEDLFRSVRGRLGSVTDTMSNTSKVPPLPTRRFARDPADLEARAHSADDNNSSSSANVTFWGGHDPAAREKSVLTQESSSVATSYASEAPVSQSAWPIIAHDFAHAGPFRRPSVDAATAITAHGSPPPTASLASYQRRRNSSNELIRVGSSSSSTNNHFSFHTPHRGPRFGSPTLQQHPNHFQQQQQYRPESRSPGIAPLTRIDTNTSLAISLQDVGGLLGAAPRSPRMTQSGPEQALARGAASSPPPPPPPPPTNDAHASEQSRRRFLGFESWRRPGERRLDDSTPVHQDQHQSHADSGSSARRPASKGGPMDLQDPGGLLGP